MTRVVRILFVAIVALAAAGVTKAEQRPFVGARNLGMGNAGVASTIDAMSVYFNPAGMAFAHGWEVQLPLVTVDAEVGSDLFSAIDDIGDSFDGTSLTEFQQRFNDGTATRDDLAQVLDAFLYKVPKLSSADGGGAGGTLRGIAGPAFRWKNWGVSAAFIGSGGGDAVIDLENGLSLSPDLNYAAVPDDGSCGGNANCLALAGDLQTASGGQLSQAQAETLVDAAGSKVFDDPTAQSLLNRIVEATAGGDGIENNQSGLATSSLAITQVAGTYSHMIWKNQLSIGGNFKLMRGEASRADLGVAELEGGEDAFQDLLDDSNTAKTSTEFGLDIGLMYRPNAKWSVGLVGMNLNSPEFEFADSGSVELDPLFTLGGAFVPVKWFQATLDVDLNDSDSNLIQGYSRQYWKLGTEFLIGRIVSIWLGGYQNFAPDNTDPVYTGGLGLRFGHFQIGLAVAASSASIDLDENSSIPQGGGAALTFAWLPKRL